MKQTEQILKILPERISLEITALMKNGMKPEEIRLRSNGNSSVTSMGKNIILTSGITHCEMSECIKKLCGGSVYAYDETVKNGYIHCFDGVRVGLCGIYSQSAGTVREITSLNIRLPCYIEGLGRNVAEYFLKNRYSILFFSGPGVGKTTLLRDMAAILSKKLRVALIDTRRELFIPELFENSMCDALCGYPKALGIEIAVRTLSPEMIICDEIGDDEECKRLLSAAVSGIPIIASAHSSNIGQLFKKPNIQLLAGHNLFERYISLSRKASGFEFSVFDTNGEALREL